MGKHMPMPAELPAGGPDWIAGPSWTGVTMVATTRLGGISRMPYDSLNLATHVGDAPAAVAANRARLRARLPGEPCWLEQVHGTALHDADDDADAGASVDEPRADDGPGADAAQTRGTPAAAPQADAAVTGRAGRVLAIMTADCLPVVIVDAAAQALAAAHAGWRGLAAGVLEAAVAGVRAKGGTGRLRAWIGPAIGPAAFEVGPDVLDAFAGCAPAAAFAPHPAHAGKWLADLPAIAAARLRAAGVGEVAQSGLCSYTDPRFYSYRRDGCTGRFATLAWLHGARMQG